MPAPDTTECAQPPKTGSTGIQSALRPGVAVREMWSWAMYDFANSGYTTVVITALFNAYFVAVVAGNAPWATFAWTAALSLSYLLIVISAPVVGAYADLRAAKKKLLAVTTVGCILFTALLYFATPATLVLTIICVIVSNFFFGSGENLIAAFLTEIAEPDAMGRVSGWGWGLGYVGGLVTLGLCLGYVIWAEAQGQTAQQFVPVTMLITACMFALASLPTFLLLRERATPVNHGSTPASNAWLRVWQTLRHLRRFADLRRFLVCSLFYQAGIGAAVTLTAVYASQALAFTTQQTLWLVLVVNVTAAAGAILFGNLEDRVGHVRFIALTLTGWIVAILVAWAASGQLWFWVAANIAGLCLGASQSAGRALVGVFTPESRTAEFFGLWGLAVKLASIAGPLTYGAATWITGGNHRQALLITGSYFVIGLLLLAGVDTARGRRAALQAEGLMTTPGEA
ncbi:MAG TPA: MFS transporter [Gallionella sp.]|nr:MFS transporter [Gallionella sp.]